MTDEGTTRPHGPKRVESAADGDTLLMIPEEGEAVRVVPSDELPRTERSPTDAKSTAERVAVRFEAQGEIARGGMGSVHRVLDKAILRTVAQKRLHDAVRMLPGAAARFLEEAQITGQLDHPNIVPVYDIGIDDDGRVMTFTMKMVRGKTLKELASEAHSEGLNGKRIEALLQVFLKVCDAVAFAHSRGVLHRDLKPDNVMVGSHGQVYLMDWGVAQLLGGSRPSDLQVDAAVLGAPPESSIRREHARAVVGTPAYMAPEQAQGKAGEIDERTDVFGLGAILYRVLTGRAPFSAKSGEQAIALAAAGVVQSPESIAPGIRLPPGLSRITMKALAADPLLRYQNVDALRDDIAAFLRGGGWFRTIELRAGTVIVREGEPPDAAYIINRGQCEAYKISGGKKRSLRKMGPGEVFGETSIFTAQPRTASVVAVDDVEVTEITLDALEQEFEERTWMRAFVRGLAERFLDADRELGEMRASKRKT